MANPAVALPAGDLRKRAKSLVIDLEARERTRLRGRVRLVRVARKRAMHRIRAWAKGKRNEIRLRAMAHRARCLNRIRRAAARERELVRKRKELLLASAKRRLSDVESKRVRELERELAGQRLIQERERKRIRGPSAKERKSESDDSVRGNISRDLLPVFNAVREIIKAGPRRTRTEAFLEWVHENPETVLNLQAEAANRDVRRLVAEQHEAERRQVRAPQHAKGWLAALWHGLAFELHREPSATRGAYAVHVLKVHRAKAANGGKRDQVWEVQRRVSDNDWSLVGLERGTAGDEKLVREWVDTLDGWSPLDDLSDVPF